MPEGRCSNHSRVRVKSQLDGCFLSSLVRLSVRCMETTNWSRNVGALVSVTNTESRV
jgi:hypothetical protein